MAGKYGKGAVRVAKTVDGRHPRDHQGPAAEQSKQWQAKSAASDPASQGMQGMVVDRGHQLLGRPGLLAVLGGDAARWCSLQRPRPQAPPLLLRTPAAPAAAR